MDGNLEKEVREKEENIVMDGYIYPGKYPMYFILKKTFLYFNGIASDSL